LELEEGGLGIGLGVGWSSGWESWGFGWRFGGFGHWIEVGGDLGRNLIWGAGRVLEKGEGGRKAGKSDRGRKKMGGGMGYGECCEDQRAIQMVIDALAWWREL